MTVLTPYCPRCGGRMFPGSDLYGEYTNCLTCGFYQDVTVGPPIELKPTWFGRASGRDQRGGQRGPSTRKGKVKL